MTDQLWIARITPVALPYLSSWDYRGGHFPPRGGGGDMGAHGSPHPGNRRETGAFAWGAIRSQNHIIRPHRYDTASSWASIGGPPSATRQAAKYARLVQSMEKST
jgi:hypothetical protein